MTDLASETRAAAAAAAARPFRAVAGVHHADAPLYVKLARAQALCDTGRYADAEALLAEATPLPPGRPQLAFRVLTVQGWLALARGDVGAARAKLLRARELSEGEELGDRERAEALMRLGACDFRRSATARAVALLTLALELCERCPEPADWVRAQALVWRARCYQRQREWEAARDDVESALELANSLQDEHAAAHAYFQASLIAERQKQWLLACYYAEEARTRFELVDDRLNIARLTNNLGGLLFLLGRPEEAERQLERAHELALAAGSEADAAQALSSLAQVHLRSGRHEAAEREARTALSLLEARRDFRDELGNTSLVLGRALLEQGRLEEAGRWFDAAELAFDEVGSVSHRAAAWVAQGDLAAGNEEPQCAAALYRRAAEALQDFHF
jgi:tetratricopeptide (TPR) repeat protein